MAERLAIIGGDAAGMSAASVARRRAEDLEIVAFERGRDTSYSACGIPYYISGTVDDVGKLIARRPEKFRERGIDVHVRSEVVALDLDARRLRVRDLGSGDERDEGFDQLVYATGAEAIAPPIPGAEAVEPVRVPEDAERFRAELDREGGGAAVVIGASYLGLEMAEGMRKRGFEVTLVDRAEQVMGTLDADIAARVQEGAEEEGIRVLLGTDIEEIELRDDGRPVAVRTPGERLAAQHVVLSTGVGPAVGLAREAGLELGPTGALRVDDRQRCPGHDGVFAAGDCVESHHRLLDRPVNVALGTHANKQGRVAGVNATGGDVRFPGLIGTAVSRICKYEVARTGLSEREAAEAGVRVATATIEALTRAAYYPGSGKIWVKLVAETGSGRLLGGQIVGVEGAAKRIDVLAACVWTGMPVEELEQLDLGYAPPFSGVYDPVLVAARRTAQAVAGAAPEAAAKRPSVAVADPG